MLQLLLILAFTVHSAEHELPSVRFTSVQELSPQTVPLVALKNNIHFLESSNGRCTSTNVSREGHQLTARHCLQHCLIRTHVFRKQLEQNMVTYFELDSTQLGKAQCEVKIDGQLQNITIEATSPGLILSLDETSFYLVNPEKFHLLKNNGYTSEGDFVIFKTKEINTSCIPLIWHEEDLMKLETLGYPSPTNRPDGFNSNGLEMYYSKGVSIDTILQNSCLQELQTHSRKVQSLVSSFDQKTSFVSTLDATYGSSGSAVFNEQGNIVGILMQVYRHANLTQKKSDEPEQRYCRGSAKALKSSTLRRYLPSKLIATLNQC